MRKILSCILAVAMLLSLLVVAGAAEADTPGKVILRPSAKVNGDGTVTYTFTLDATESDGVGALEFFITPKEGMTYKSVAYKDGGKLDEVFKSEDDYEGVTGYGFYETDGHFIAFGGNANAVSPRMLTGSVPLIAVTYKITDASNYGLEEVTFKACYSGEKAMTESGRYTCEIADVTTEPTGVTVSGTAISWNDQNVAVYLYPITGTDLSIRKALKEGDTSGALATATVGTVSGPDSGKYEQTYSISDVEPGEYRLVAHKSGYAAHIETVTLDSGEIDKSLTIYRLGDINLDGEVSGVDRMILARYLANWHGEYDKAIVNGEITWNIADINLDGEVSGVDRMILARYLANWHGEYDEYFK